MKSSNVFSQLFWTLRHHRMHQLEFSWLGFFVCNAWSQVESWRVAISCSRQVLHFVHGSSQIYQWPVIFGVYSPWYSIRVLEVSLVEFRIGRVSVRCDNFTLFKTIVSWFQPCKTRCKGCWEALDKKRLLLITPQATNTDANFVKTASGNVTLVDCSFLLFFHFFPSRKSVVLEGPWRSIRDYPVRLD